MPPTRRGLGRGLEALIPSGGSTVGVLEVDVEDISPNPRQPRRRFDSDSLRELASSIREHGLIQPLIATQAEPLPESGEAGPRYRLIAGERRWRAAKMAGLQRVPVIVKEVSPPEALQLALVENIQRSDLNPLEEAAAYDQLIDEFGFTQEEIASRVGRSRSSVANALRLLSLSGAVQDALREGRISEGHARAILGLKREDEQVGTLRVVLKRDLTVRQTEELVRRLASEARRPRSTHTRSPETVALENAFRNALGTKVSLTRSKKGGRLVIHYYSEEELQRLFSLITED